MTHLFNLLLIGLVLFNTLGLALLTARPARLPLGLALGVSVVTLCLGLFFVEHFVGLGSLNWLLPITTLAFATVLWRRRGELRAANADACLAGLAGFGYAAGWRYFFPDITNSTERLPDACFIADYLAGTRLPPPDLWYPPFTLNHYYSFQHYGAGLLGRMFGLPAGTATNIAYCLLTGLTMAAAYEAVRRFCPAGRRGLQALVLAVFLVGGTGACVFTPFMMAKGKTEDAWASMRFIGTTTALPDEDLSAFGRAVKAISPPKADPTQNLELPCENMSYVVELGDYHAPLGGFFILALALAAAAILLEDPRHFAGQVLLAATLPLTLATNTWTFPFQTVFAAGLLLYLWLEHRILPDWRALAVGALGTGLLFYPFFSYFLPGNVGNRAPVRWTPAEWRTPTPYFLMFFWPVIAVSLLHLLDSRGPRRLLACFWLAALGFAELFFVDDIYAGSAERFNTTLKWWPWVFNGVLLSLAAMNLGSPRRLVRWGTLFTLVACLSYVTRLGGLWWRSPKEKDHVGRLDGTAWLRADPVVGSVLDFLRAQPPGVLMESPDERAFAQTGAFAVFTGHPAVVGWASHEKLWRNDQTDIEDRYAKSRAFYAGELEDPLPFLDTHAVRYILWLPRNNAAANPAASGLIFNKLNVALAPRYVWNEFYRAGDLVVGVWVRR